MEPEAEKEGEEPPGETQEDLTEADYHHQEPRRSQRSAKGHAPHCFEIDEYAEVTEAMQVALRAAFKQPATTTMESSHRLRLSAKDRERHPGKSSCQPTAKPSSASGSEWKAGRLDLHGAADM